MINNKLVTRALQWVLWFKLFTGVVLKVIHIFSGVGQLSEVEMPSLEVSESFLGHLVLHICGSLLALC